jgi:diguanylate cyclase (GGDEF)-like protein
MKSPAQWEREAARLRAELDGLKADVDRRALDMDALRDASRLYSAILDALPTEVAVLDATGEIVAVNRAWRAFADAEGLKLADHGVGSNYLKECFRAKGPDAAAARQAGRAIAAVLEGRSPSFTLEYACHSPEQKRWFSLMAAPLLAGGFRGAVTLHVDISDRVLAEERAGHMAHHDALTGLPNRRLFHDRLRQAIAQARRRRELVALLYIDLDNFKAVNDSFGHACGDAVLTEVANRMRATTRDADTLARTGGDEFTLVATQLSEPAAADRIADKLIAAATQPIAAGEVEVRMGASIGISIWPADGDNADALERCADEAMYRAKQAGKNRYYRYSAEP